MDNKGKSTFMRLKKVLLNDKTLPNGLLGVLMSDLDNVFKSYFDYESKDMSVDLDIDPDGKYVLKIAAPIERIKSVKVL